MSAADFVLDVRDLTIARADGTVLVDHVSLHVPAGQVTALVGESGSGKTLTALAVMGLLPSGLQQVAGQLIVAGTELSAQTADTRRLLRGHTMSMVFQEPMTALDPVMRIDRQMLESRRRVASVRGAAAKQWCLEALAAVGIADASRVARSFPHELSGGMRQRVLLAMALAAEPRLLLADEPTTALDAVNRAGVLDLITSACATGAGVLLVTHDFAAVRGWAQQIAVMWRGRLVEAGPASQVLSNPTHPYTAALLECVPKGDTGPLIDVEQVLEAARRDYRIDTTEGSQVPWWPDLEGHWGMRGVAPNHQVACSLCEPEKCFRT